MTVGIPKALLYYRYSCLWECFFKALGFNVSVSSDTTRSILESGSSASTDECCLPSKIFMGHALSLSGKCDAIFVPRYDNLGRNDEFCVRFRGLYDVTKTAIPKERLITLDVNVKKHKCERSAFMLLGMKLGKSPVESLFAYNEAKLVQRRKDGELAAAREERLRSSRLKILLCGHPYLVRDKFIAEPIVSIIRGQGGEALDARDMSTRKDISCDITRGMYWQAGKENASAAAGLAERVDGVILLSAFPCGSDAMINEVIMRSVRNIPVIQIIYDGLSGDAGLITRVESFMDILRERNAHGNFIAQQEGSRPEGILKHEHNVPAFSRL